MSVSFGGWGGCLGGSQRRLVRCHAGTSRKINSSSISTANQDADALAGLRLVTSGQQSCESGGAARFGDDSQSFPKKVLGFLNGVVGHKRHATDKFLRDGKHQRANLLGSEGISGDSSRGAVDGMSGLQGIVKSRRSLGLDANNFDLIRIPGGDAADEATTADGNQQGIEVGRLLLEFETNRGLAEQSFPLVIGVDF